MDSTQPPTTIEGVGIHLVYLTKSVEELKTEIKAMRENQVPISVHLAFKEDVEAKLEKHSERLESLELSREKVWGIWLAITAAASIVAFAISNVVTYFSNHGL